MNPICLLVESCFQQPPLLTSRPPTITPLDIEPRRVIVGPSAYQTIFAAKKLVITTPLSDDARPALFLYEPFDTRFEMTLLELMVVGGVLPRLTNEGYINAVMPAVFQQEEWLCFWNRVAPNAVIPKMTSPRPAVLFQNDPNVAEHQILLSLAGLGPDSVWCQRADLLERPERWLAIVDYLAARFAHVELVSSPQSAFPVPHTFIMARGRYPNDNPPPPLDRNFDLVIGSGTRDAFALLEYEQSQVIARNRVRMDWVQQHSAQEISWTCEVVNQYLAKLKACGPAERPRTPDYFTDGPYY